MNANTNLARHLKLLRLGLLLVLCAGLLPLAACKKKEAAAATDAAGAAGAAPAVGAPTEATPKDEPSFELKAKWSEGQRLVVQIVTHTESEMTNPAVPQPITTENLTTLEIAFIASKEQEAGGREVEVEIASVKVENKVAGKFVPMFDPKGDPKAERANPSAGAFRKLLSSRVKYQIDAAGSVSKVEGLTQLVTRVTTGQPPQSQFLIRTLLAEDTVRGWNTLHQNLPTNSVKAGDTWGSTRDLPLGIAKFEVNTTNTFKGWEQRGNKKVAKFETVGVITTKGTATTSITIVEGATVTGTSWYEPTLGVITESDTTANFSINISQATGQAIVSKVKTKTTSKLIEGRAPGAEPAAAPPADKKPVEKK